MRIALATYGIKFGGVEAFLKRLAFSLRESGHEVQFVETEERGEWAVEFERDGFGVTDVLPHPFRSRKHHVRRIVAELRGFDVVVLNDAPFAQAALGLLPASTACLPIVHLDLDSFYSNALGSPGEYDAIVSVGPRLTRVLVDKYEVPRDVLREIPYGVEVPDRWPREETIFTNGDPLKVVFVGRIEDRQKGVLRLPSIIEEASRTTRLALEIVGDGPDVAQLRDGLESMCHGVPVTFHGRLPTDKAREVLAAQDILVLPSKFEGYPIVVLEAMASGVVPIVSRMPGATDCQVTDGKNGFLVQSDDACGFAGKVALLGRRGDMLREMSQSAWEEAHRRFRVEDTNRRYLELIQELQAVRVSLPRPRCGAMDVRLLGDLPGLPVCLVRPVRKALRLLGLWQSGAVSDAT